MSEIDQSTYVKFKYKSTINYLRNNLKSSFAKVKETGTIKNILYFIFSIILIILSSIFLPFSYLKDLITDLQYSEGFLEYQINQNQYTANDAVSFLRTELLKYKKKKLDNSVHYSEYKHNKVNQTFEYLLEKYIYIVEVNLAKKDDSGMEEKDIQHQDIISNFTTLQQSIEFTNTGIQNLGKDINSLSSHTEDHTKKLSQGIDEIKQQTASISQYTNKKLAEEQETEQRIAERIQKKKANYNREKARNLDSFESALSDEQIDILVKYCNRIPVFKIEITAEEIKGILFCIHSRPLQTTVNKYVALLFERLSEEKLICKTWKSVAMNKKCFVSSNGKELTAKDLSSAHGTSSLIKSQINDLIEECIDEIKNHS